MQTNPTTDKLLTTSMAPSIEGLKASTLPKYLAEAKVPAVVSTNATDSPAITARNFFMIKEERFP
jgi:hypothetical protein